MCLVRKARDRKRLLQYLMKRNKIILLAVMLVIALVTVFNSDLSPDLYFLYWGELENVSCHYLSMGNALPPVPEDFDPPPKSIYFHETSCRGLLNSRQACAVESAARAHPDWQVNLLIAGPVSGERLSEGALGALNQFENLSIMRLFLLDYAQGTPVEDMVSKGALNKTRWRISHTSDLLRYLTLYKWGGVYLDLDIVVLKPFDELVNNWAARESTVSASAGALAFSNDELGRTVAEAALRDFKQRFRGDSWSNNGPGVITRVLQRMCDTADLAQMSADTCYGFEVYGPDLFYPIPWTEAHQYLEANDFTGDPYIHHVWNKFTKQLPIGKDSLYAKLAQKYCPTIYDMYKNNFGD